MDIVSLIKNAKLGGERKAAQVDSCAPFAAALFDVLKENGLDASLSVASHRAIVAQNSWYHGIVEYDGSFYDSLGEFSPDIMRKRLKIHPSVDYQIAIKADRREGFYEDEEEEMYAFFLKALRKSAKALPSLTGAPVI